MMARLTVLEVIMQAFFVTQALDEVQVGFAILHAVVPWRITCTQLEAMGIGENAVLLEDRRNDLRNTDVLENALVGTVFQVSQSWNQSYLVMRQAFACVALYNTIDQPVNTAPCLLNARNACWFSKYSKSISLCSLTSSISNE